MSNIEDRLRTSMLFDVMEGSAEERGILECQIEEAIRELVRLRARAEAAERERDEARAACSEACTEAGSLTAALEQERTLSSHLQERATAAEARVRELEERITALDAQLTTRAALAGEASGNEGLCQRCDGSGYEVDLYPDGSADREPCGTCNTPEKARQA